MRPLVVLLQLMLAIVADPAHADVTARYYAWGPIGRSVAFEVADNGDARVRRGGETVAVRRDGITFLVRRDAQGTFVLRASEFRRIEAQFPFPEMSEDPPVQVAERSVETIGGRQGIVLGPSEGPPGNPDWAYVVSRDPDLIAMGPIVAEMFGGSLDGIDPGQASIMRQLQARGTLVRLGPLLRLEEVSRAPIPADAFTLTGPELNGEEARTRLGRAW